jgi:hypothetical protein
MASPKPKPQYGRKTTINGVRYNAKGKRISPAPGTRSVVVVGGTVKPSYPKAMQPIRPAAKQPANAKGRNRAR